MKVENMVPQVYYKDSRDFSYIGRLFEVAFNFYKSGSDIVAKGLRDENATSLIDLMCSSLGFKIKHKYINQDLIAISGSFANILKKKGSKEAIEECVKILLNAQYLSEVYYVSANNETCVLTVYISSSAQDTILLEDLFDYILPAGWIYRIYKITISNVEYNDRFVYSDYVEHYLMTLRQLSQISRPEDVDTLEENISNRYSNIGVGEQVDRSHTFTGVVFGVDIPQPQQQEETPNDTPQEPQGDEPQGNEGDNENTNNENNENTETENENTEVESEGNE